MNSYFYYFGFLYLIDLFYELWKVFNGKGIAVIHKGMTFDEIQDIADKRIKVKDAGKAPLNYIIGTIFLVWAIIGYVNDAPEKIWFLSDVIFIIGNTVILFLYGMFIAIGSMKIKPKIYNVDKKKPIIIPYDKIAPLVELFIVSNILSFHFFLK